MELNLVHSNLGITTYFSENTAKKQVKDILLHLRIQTQNLSTY